MTEELAAADSGAATRRRLLLGAGAVGATAVLAACGTDDADSGGSGPAGPGATTPPAAGDQTSAAGGTKIAAAADIPVGGGAIFASQGVVVTQPTEGTFRGFSSTCTHQGCPLASVDGGTINCSCHGSKFSLDGSVKNGPASKPLDEKTVTRDGDNILLA
jgi:Rieske Fe-S protein